MIRLETPSNFEERFDNLAHEIKRRSDVPQGNLLGKIEALQSQVDELKRVADSDVRFRELAERVSQLEKTNSLEVRFNKLASEIWQGSEISQSELLGRTDGLQRQLDELKKIAGQPGPQGPPGKLPCVKEYVAECVCAVLTTLASHRLRFAAALFHRYVASCRASLLGVQSPRVVCLHVMPARLDRLQRRDAAPRHRSHRKMAESDGHEESFKNHRQSAD